MKDTLFAFQDKLRAFGLYLDESPDRLEVQRMFSYGTDPGSREMLPVAEVRIAADSVTVIPDHMSLEFTGTPDAAASWLGHRIPLEVSREAAVLLRLAAECECESLGSGAETFKCVGSPFTGAPEAHMHAVFEDKTAWDFRFTWQSDRVFMEYDVDGMPSGEVSGTPDEILAAILAIWTPDA